MNQKLLLSLSVILVLTGCFSKATNEKSAQAQKNANYVIDNLDKPTVAQHFPEKYFRAADITGLIESLKDCDWVHKERKLVSSVITYHTSRGTSTILVYDCNSHCGQYRFTLVYNLDGPAPVLQRLNTHKFISQ